MAKKKTDKPPVIIIKKGGKRRKAAHHGGAWKVAYADFTTAMMCFFLVMWLLGITSEEQKQSLSRYFGPTGLVPTPAAGDGTLEGAVAPPPDAFFGEPDPLLPVEDPETVAADEQTSQNGLVNLKNLADVEEQRKLESLEKELRQILEDFGKDVGILDNISITMLPEGLRIQLIDQANKSMFPLGSAQMYPYTTEVLKKIAAAIQRVPNNLVVTGHTDAKPYNNSETFGNWELSSERAHAARRVLEQGGIPESRFSEVVGKGTTELLVKDDPYSPRNRRITVLVLKRNQPVPQKIPIPAS